jgi:hypothetical protein
MSFLETYGPLVDMSIDYMTPEYIQYYAQDGFREVCRLEYYRRSNFWDVHVVDEQYMWDDHKSWIYIITDGNRVMKIGESGNPLGIRSRNGVHRSTQCRIGRILSGDGTDSDIRRSLAESAARAPSWVSIWAKRCDIITKTVVVGGQGRRLPTTYHKALELAYLDAYGEATDHYPPLNKGRK